MSKVRCSALLLGLVAMGWTSLATAAEPQSPFFLDRGVLIDPAGGLLVSMRPAGGLEAVELATGRLLWRSDAADVPIAMSDEVVFAQRNSEFRAGTLPIVAVDRRGGQTLGQVEVSIPDNLFARVDSTRAAAFRVDGWFEAGKLQLSWSFHRPRIDHPRKGRIDEGSQEGATAEIDWPGLSVRPVSARNLDSGTRRRLGMGGTPGEAPDAKRRGEYLATARVTAPRTVEVLRFGTDTGSLVDVTGIALRDGFQRHYPSVDGQHFLTSRRLRDESVDAGQDLYRWLILNLPDGNEVAEVDVRGPGHAFFLWGDLLIHKFRTPLPAETAGPGVSSLAVTAVRTSDGAIAWTRSYRDTSFRGQKASFPEVGR